ncbi:HAMP domain-containing protein [Anaerobacterium chartisolvens]|uniref:histidine kinase n=1 Tax=Anaerobacterium chartisolvens TaxID=1297424 RepID=A0A369B777_9FIRM|nr:ATP-binding protein [Anaerobacterium chartisolvens]RCX16387.1 HAMP domain-containing protein [Anaerobacterium chartisolvens]
MDSIKKRLVLYFIFIVVFTVIILEVLIANIVRQNYYKNLEDILSNQIRVSCDLYLRYFSDSTLYDNVMNNVDTFWRQVPAQVQIIDTQGKLIMDSIGVIPPEGMDMPDVVQALKGEKGKWMGSVNYDSSQVMAVAYPLRSQERIVGALRFISSLGKVNEDIKRVESVFLLIGGIVIILSSLLSVILSNSIVNPLKEVTEAAEKMASGNFKVQSRKRYDDEVGKLSDTLNYMAEEITKKDQLKNDFISSVSHELRTPLTSIKGWAVTLKEGNAYEEEMLRDGLEIIEKEADRLTTMVEELLDFSRFVSGKIAIKKEYVDVGQVMEHIRKQLKPRSERDNISLQVEYPDDLPFMMSDENRLKQVFINILDNSFKFTPSGGSILFKAGYTGKYIEFFIKDSGCGIPGEELPKVKDKFYKGRNSKSRNGIGLSVCDEIIKLMNGSFEIKSEVDKGTETLIKLPV